MRAQAEAAGNKAANLDHEQAHETCRDIQEVEHGYDGKSKLHATSATIRSKGRRRALGPKARREIRGKMEEMKKRCRGLHEQAAGALEKAVGRADGGSHVGGLDEGSVLKRLLPRATILDGDGGMHASARVWADYGVAPGRRPALLIGIDAHQEAPTVSEHRLAAVVDLRRLMRAAVRS